MKRAAKTPPVAGYRYALHALVVSVLATGLVLYFTLDENTFEAVAAFNRRYALYCIAAVLGAWLATSLRLLIWARGMGYPFSYLTCIRVVMSAEFAVGATPAGVGGPLVRIGLMNQQGMPISLGMATQAADIVLDVLFFLLLAPFAVGALLRYGMQLSASGDDARHLIVGVSIMVGLAALTLTLARIDAVGGRLARRMLRTGLSRRWRVHQKLAALRHSLRRLWREFRQGLGVLRRMSWWAIGAAFLCTVLQWSGRYCVLPILLWGFGVHGNMLLLFFIQGFLFFGGLSVLLPGGGGSVEAAFAILLTPVAPAGTVGVLLLLWRFFTYHLYLIAGGLAFVATVSSPKFLLLGMKDNGQDEDGA